MLGMNKLTTARRAQILGMMVEGMSIRAITRMTGASKNTVAKLLVDAGEACSAYMDQAFRNLPCKRLQVDEIWSFVYAKERNVATAKNAPEDAGDVWTWTAIDADTKLIPSFYVGGRTVENAEAFLGDLRGRLANRVQLTSDGLRAYLETVERVFDGDVDYAMIVKIYGQPEGARQERRYSQPECIGAKKEPRVGNPDMKHVSTSYVERSNLSIRMGLRRFTRLTNAFSKKVENHAHALAIYFMHYNFARIHTTLRVAPAMAAGVSDKLWSVEDIVRMVEAHESGMS